MSSLPIEHGAIIEVYILKRFEDLRTGYVTMLNNTMAEHKEALDGRLDLQDAAIASIKDVAVDTNINVKQLIDNHNSWHDDDIEFRVSVKTDISELQKQFKAIKLFIAICSGFIKSAKYVVENGDKATGLTVKLILGLVLYLTGQSVYFRFLQNHIHWLHK